MNLVDDKTVTAGPWQPVLTQARQDGPYLFVIPVYSGGVRVAEARGVTMEIALSNAELIAKAPQLRDACYKAIHHLGCDPCQLTEALGIH